MADAKLQILLDLQDNVSGAIGSVNSALEGVASKAKELEPAFKKMAAVGTAGFAAIAAGAAAAISNFGEAERAQRQLEHAVIDVSKGTREQVKAISDLSDALQKKVGIDGDALKMGAAQLSTFGLQSKSVQDLTKSLADFTVNQYGVNASADQYVQSANTMAKALNGQFGILEKSGIRFTEHQQAMINDGTEAQKVSAMIEGLNQNLRETTDTMSGVDAASAKIQRSFGEVMESIGKSLAPAFQQLSAAITPIINGLADWIAEHPELTKWIVIISAAIFGLLAVVGTLGLAIPAIIAGFTALGAAITFATGPVGIIIVAIGALVAALLWLWKNQAYVKDNLIAAWEMIKTNIGAVIDWLKAKFQEFMDWVNGIVSSIVGAVQKALDAVAKLPGVSSVVSAAKSVGSAVSSAASAVGGLLTGRAAGGPVAAGTPYLVGENGPELFVPSTYGRIAGAGAGGIVVNINGGNFYGIEDLADRVGDAIMRQVKNNTRV